MAGMISSRVHKQRTKFNSNLAMALTDWRSYCIQPVLSVSWTMMESTPKKHGRQQGLSYPIQREISRAVVTIIYFLECPITRGEDLSAVFDWLRLVAIAKTARDTRSPAVWTFWLTAMSYYRRLPVIEKTPTAR